MINSHSKYLLGLYKAVCEDCRGTFPGLRRELERDYLRLHSLVEARGLRVLTLDLPALGKEFDRSLHSGRLTLSPSYLSSRKRKDSPIPKLFSGLMIRVFDELGVLRFDACTEAVTFLRQFFLMAKKWKVPCAETLTYREVREFYRVDETVQRPTLKWGEPYLEEDIATRLSFCSNVSFREGMQQGVLPGFTSRGDDLMQAYGLDRSRHAALLGVLQQVADRLSATLGYFEPGDMLAKHGPGVVSDLHKGISKYEFPTWSERLEGVFQQARFAFANYGLWADFVSANKLTNALVTNEDIVEHTTNLHSKKRFEGIEMYSRLIAVPKTQKGPRLIAAEPTANQWCQQIVRQFLYDRTHASWIGKAIAFNDQRPNQRAALAASLSGNSSTIDLSSASDRLSCWVVERLFRGNISLLRALHATRTLVIRNLIDKKSPEFHFLAKFSTMGSALTFPIQSFAFLAICLAAAHFVDGKRVSEDSCADYCNRVRVFGDDIICPTETTEVTLYLLQYLGFEVNAAKTYSGYETRFRESCGIDAFRGVNVTPAYALEVPRQSAPGSFVSNVAVAHNFFNKKLMATAEFIQRTTTEAGLKPLPFVKTDSGVFGWPSTMGFDVADCPVRYNTDLQRMEYRARSVVSRVTRLADRGPSRLLQYFVEAPLPSVYWVSGVAVKGAVLTRPRWTPFPA